MKHLTCLIALWLIFGCSEYQGGSQYVFSVYNNSSDTIQVCLKANPPAYSSYFASNYDCETLIPKRLAEVAYYRGRGKLIDYWKTGDIVVIDQFDVYQDSVLVQKDFLQRDLWEYREIINTQSEYRLEITDEDFD